MKRKYIALLLALSLVLSLALCACGGGGGEPEPDTPPAQATDVPEGPAPDAGLPEVESQEYHHEYTAEDGTVLLVCDYTLPFFPDAAPDSAGAIISAYYAELMDELIAEGPAYLEWAQTEYNEAGVNYPYADEDSYEETFRDDACISFLRQHYSYAGGAHPSTVLFAETFRVADGFRVSANDLFSVEQGTWRPAVIQAIRDQMAEQGWENYYEEYTTEAIDAVFQPDQFYLTEDGIVWFFQAYDVAPYAAGIPTFTIPYDQLGEMLA